MDSIPVNPTDTPGFSDTKISEIEIIGMIQPQLIDKTRLPGSRRRTVALLKEYIDSPGDDHVCMVVVKSMRDILHNDCVKRHAESNLASCKTKIASFFFKYKLMDYITKDAETTRFMNTGTSITSPSVDCLKLQKQEMLPKNESKTVKISHMINHTIPYDIWETVISTIADIPRPQHPPEGRLHLLATCAVLCKDFSELCRPHIFEHISGIEVSFEYFDGNRFRKLVDSLTSNPDLVRYIRTLSVSLPIGVEVGNDGTNSFPRKEIDHIFSIFAHIPRLELISIRAPGNPMTRVQAEEFQSIVVKAHLLRSTLHTLDIHYVPYDVTIMDIICSPSLRSLSLTKCANLGPLSFTIGRPCTISRLHIVTEYPETPLILLDYLPNLTHLELVYVRSSLTAGQGALLDIIPTRPSGSMFDPSNLKRIQVEMFPLFFQFCVDRKVRGDVPLFASLEEFHQGDGRGEGLEVVRDILKETQSLQSLTLACSPDGSFEEYPFEIYDLSARFMDSTLGNLADLHLIVHEAPYSEFYATTLEGLVSLFASIAHLNVLKRIELSLNIDEVPPKGSVFDKEQAYEDLKPVADSLACVDAYPALKEVQIEIWVWLTNDSSNGEVDDMVSTGIDGLQNLRCRPGVVVQDTLIILYMPDSFPASLGWV
ncbi:hypothetical protein BJ165DRAFT_1593075 [Panaeolus papilionaceus]|nr:hypothetical protein BJ165DRAFT_1593075 [Panaeolus papilionaceus]